MSQGEWFDDINRGLGVNLWFFLGLWSLVDIPHLCVHKGNLPQFSNTLELVRISKPIDKLKKEKKSYNYINSHILKTYFYKNHDHQRSFLKK